LSLKLLLNLIITALLLLIMLLGLVLMLDKAREDIRAEIDSTANLALHLLDTEILYYSSGSSVNVWPDSPFRLNSLGHVRHLRIEFIDGKGRLRDSNATERSSVEGEAPDWFFKVMSKLSFSVGSQPIRRPVFFMGHMLGELVVTPDPTYEIAEIWNDTVGVVELVAVFFVLVNILIYLAVAHALKPVDKLLEALTSLEGGDMEARLPTFKLPELSLVSVKFNNMAGTLQQSLRQIHELNRKILSLQEDERRHLARELHDEIGQCLTAIHVDADAILHASEVAQAHESAGVILSVTRHMKEMVHDMLQRLRPTVLDELGLRAALLDLVETWIERNRGVAIAATIAPDVDMIGDGSIGMLAYRFVQESLTNISRHAEASQVRLHVVCHSGLFELIVEDDGHGFDHEEKASGFGLIGIRERVEGLGGRFLISSTPGHGTRMHAQLPICKGESA